MIATAARDVLDGDLVRIPTAGPTLAGRVIRTDSWQGRIELELDTGVTVRVLPDATIEVHP